MNKYKIVIMTLLLSFIFTACFKTKEADVKVTKLMDKISEKIAKDYNTTKDTLDYNRLDLTKEESKDIISTMKLKTDSVDEGIYFSDPSGKTSNRIIIVKAKKDTDIKDIVNAFEKMQEAQDKEWKEKQPEQYKKVKNGIIDTNGKYVIYMVYDDMASLMKITNDAISKSMK